MPSDTSLSRVQFAPLTRILQFHFQRKIYYCRRVHSVALVFGSQKRCVWRGREWLGLCFFVFEFQGELLELFSGLTVNKPVNQKQMDDQPANSN